MTAYLFATVSMKKYGIKQLFYCKAFFLLPPNKTAAANKSTEEEIEELRKEIKVVFDEICGKNTTDSHTF